MKYKLAELSKEVGFYRRHQRIPMMDEIEKAFEAAKNGSKDYAVLILDWRRHCFLAKSKDDLMSMARIMDCANELFE